MRRPDLTTKLQPALKYPYDFTNKPWTFATVRVERWCRRLDIWGIMQQFNWDKKIYIWIQFLDFKIKNNELKILDGKTG
jgi:hypothetical protein